MFFFQEVICTLCDEEFDGVEDMVYTFMSCLHPVCMECSQKEYEFYEFCGDCGTCVPTSLAPSDVILEADEELEGPFNYGTPEECITLVLPMIIRCMSKRKRDEVERD